MALVIENTHGWEDPDRLLQIWPSALANLRKFIAQFPDEVTEDFLIHNILSGRRHLWVVFEEDKPDDAVLCVLTEIKSNDATGKIFVEVAGLGGHRIHDCLPLVSEIEDWAAENHGAEEIMLIGRLGWRRVMSKHGFTESAVLMKKDIGVHNHG